MARILANGPFAKISTDNLFLIEKSDTDGTDATDINRYYPCHLCLTWQQAQSSKAFESATSEDLFGRVAPALQGLAAVNEQGGAGDVAGIV